MGGGIINYAKIGVRQLEMESYRTFRQYLPVFGPGADNLHHVCPMDSIGKCDGDVVRQVKKAVLRC